MSEKVVVLWDNYKRIGELQTTDHKKIIIGSACREGVKYVNLHEWYALKSAPTEWKPSNRGISLPVDAIIGEENVEGVAEEIVSLMHEALSVIVDMPIHDPLGEVTYTKTVKPRKKKKKGE